MASQNLKQELEDITALRASIRANPRLQLELRAALSRLFREHSVNITDHTLGSLIFAIYPELNSSDVSVGDLPKPDLGPAPWK